MKNTKKLFVLAAGAILTLASCGGTPTSSSTPATPTSSAEAPTSSTVTPASETPSTPAATSEAQSTPTKTSEAQSEASYEAYSESSEPSERSESSESSSAEPVIVKYAITVNDSEDVDLTVDKEEAEEGELVTIGVELADESVVLDEVLVDGVAIDPVGGVYCFLMPGNDVVVGAHSHRKLAIALPEIEGIEVEADKAYAEPGEVVSITLDYDEDAIEIFSVHANDIVCGEGEDGSYYFVMPKANVSIDVEFAAGLVYSITTASAHVDFLGDSAREGDLVVLVPHVELGYDLVSLVAETLTGDEVELIFDEADNTYSFIMPGAPVILTAETEVGYFEVVANDSAIRNVRYNDAADGEEPHWVTVGSDSHFPFGAQMQVEFRDTDTEKVTGLVLGGGNNAVVTRNEADGNYIYFTMPARKITLGLQKAELLHTAIADVSEAEHFSVTFYRKDAEGNYVPTTGFLAYEQCYVKVEIIDPELSEDYVLKALSVTYKYYTGNANELEAETRSILTAASYTTYGINGLNEDGYYDFKLLYSTGMHMVNAGDDATVTVKAVEKSTSKYKGASFVSPYYGIEVWGMRDINEFNSSYSPTIDGAGEFTLSGTTYAIFDVDYDAGMFDVGYASAEAANGKMAFNDKVIIAHYNIAADIIRKNSADVMIAVKPEEGESIDNYFVASEAFKINNNQYIVAQFFRAGSPYANVFIDAQNQLYYIEDVSFDFYEGSLVTDANASYSVKVGNETLLSIGSAGSSTNAYENRVLLDGKQGVYAVDAEALYLNGISTATYGGKTYQYSIDESGKVILTRDEITEEGGLSWTLVFSIDQSTMEATLESETSVVKSYSVNLESETVERPYSNYSYKHFTEGEPGVYSATITNSYSVFEMSVTALGSGKLSFDLTAGAYLTSYSQYAYATVYLNGAAIEGYEQFGDSSSSSSSAGTTKVEAVVNAGDVVTIAYFVKTTSSYYLPSYKTITVENIALVAPGAEAGTYSLDNEMSLTLDGFGHGTCGDASFDYTVPETGDFVVEFDLPLIEEDGITPRHFRVTLDREDKIGDVSIEVGEKSPLSINLNGSDQLISNRPTSYGFDDLGDGSYRSNNKGKGTTSAEMVISCYQDGTLAFHYEVSGDCNSGNSWDYLAIYKNGELLNKYGDTSGDYSVDVVSGDLIQIFFTKDGSDNGSAGELDGAIISNILLTVAS